MTCSNSWRWMIYLPNKCLLSIKRTELDSRWLKLSCSQSPPVMMSNFALSTACTVTLTCNLISSLTPLWLLLEEMVWPVKLFTTVPLYVGSRNSESCNIAREEKQNMFELSQPWKEKMLGAASLTGDYTINRPSSTISEEKEFLQRETHLKHSAKTKYQRSASEELRRNKSLLW